MHHDKLEIKNRIIETAHKLFEHYGYGKTTVEDIAEEAKIGKGTIYQYFKSKQDILIEVTKSYVNCIMADIEKVYESELPLKKKFIELIKTKFFTTFQYCKNTPHGHELSHQLRMMNDDLFEAVAEYREKMTRIVAGLIDEGNRIGELDVDDTKKTAKHILISFEILLPAFCMWESEEEVLDYIENLVNLYFNGMRKR